MCKCAFDRDEFACSALKNKICKGCRFFKTKESLVAGRKKATDRVLTLPEKRRKHIFGKYYGGVRPPYKTNTDDD